MQLKNPFVRLNLDLWQPLAAYASGMVVCLAFLLYRLGTLVPGFGPSEVATVPNATSLKVIFDHPTYAPHEFLQYLALKIGHHGFVAMRLPSVLFGLGSVVLLFYIIKKWFGFRVGIITSILFVSSSWFLHVARIATPEVTLLSLLAPLAYAVWLPTSKKPLLALLIGAVVLTNILYIPGLIWFALIGIVWQRKNLWQVYKEAKFPAVLTIFACIMVLSPLIISLASSIDLLQTYLGLPAHLSDMLIHIPKNLALIPYRLVLHGPTNPELNLGRLPLLDFFTFTMTIIGVYSFATHAKLRRSRLLLASIILGSLLVSLGGAVTITVLLPFVYLLVASGLNFMIEQWSVVFPLNPFARGLATALIICAMIVTVFFHINSYFLAWPQAPITRSTFNQQP